MKYDIIIAGVGGQGVLSVAAIIARAAMESGLHAVQSEVHGMSQRGGAVVAHLRLADHPIHSPTIALGQADLILSMEPLESLRYLDYLSPVGAVLSSTDPTRNIPDYPALEELTTAILALPRSAVVDAMRLAREAGSVRAANVVMVGAATDFLPIDASRLKATIEETFRSKGEKLVRVNLDAFEEGRTSVHFAEMVDAFETLATP
ncbi:MAG: indolepyruvate oxidoreductase subunit beta [Thermoanaerobaculia bacterium]